MVKGWVFGNWFSCDVVGNGRFIEVVEWGNDKGIVFCFVWILPLLTVLSLRGNDGLESSMLVFVSCRFELILHCIYRGIVLSTHLDLSYQWDS
jgi:hypothetical protein